MARYEHDELIALCAAGGGVQSLGVLKGEAVLNRLPLPQASTPVAAQAAPAQSWLTLGTPKG